jgi:hypothetical protein
VQLDGTHYTKGRKPQASLLAHAVKRLLQGVAAAAVVGALGVVFVLGLASLVMPPDDDNAHKRTHWTEAA